MKRIFFVFISFVFSFSLAYAQNDTTCKHPNIKIAGPTETVFSYANDRCSRIDTPDTPAMAFKDANGLVHLFNGIPGSYASTGTSLNHVHRDCSQPISNELIPPSPQTPDSHDNWKWFRSPWTFDGKIIYGLVHNEFHGTDNKQKYCPSGKGDPCLYPNVTVSRSTDGGKTFKVLRDKDHKVVLAFVAPYAYNPKAKKQAGIRAPSNIISIKKHGKTYFYVLANNRGTRGIDQKGGTCLYRSDDIKNAHRWRGWDGKDFNVVVNATPYRDKNIDSTQHICKPIFGPNPSSWTYNTVLNQFVAIIGVQDGKMSFGYVTSSDMIHWSKPTVIMPTTFNAYLKSKRGSPVSGQTYPSLIDPKSPGLNFEYSGSHPYLYYTRMNPRMGNWHNRDLLRVRLDVSCGP